MTQRIPSLCNSCIHRLTGETCNAFPAGIPDGFLTWGEPHLEPINRQGNDLVWEFRPGSMEEYNDWRIFQEQPIK